jgi:DNA-binding SARP family transcriptional activator
VRFVRVRVRLLGGFDVELEGRSVPAGQWARRSATSLVKLLALSERRRLHREQVIDALWAESSVDRAAPRLHQSAHYVRRATGIADSIVLADQMVALFPNDDVAVDAVEFERCAAEALETGEPAALTAALACYRGELLPDDRYESWTLDGRDRLHLRYRQLLRRAGRWADLIAADPTDEDAHIAVLRQLVDAGDRSGARQQFDMLRRVLHEELAVEPSAEAVALYERSLAISRTAPGGGAPPAHAGPSTVPDVAPLPSVFDLLADGETFVGRAAEQRALREAWQLARAGHTLLVIVSGEPGIGKSRLVSELAVEAHAEGGHVLLGSCHEDVDEPFGPFIEAIVAEAGGVADDELQRRAGADRDALARLAPELAPRLVAAATEASTRGTDGPERAETLAVIARWFRAGAASRPTLLVVEDLHWSTSTTRDALRHVVRGGPRLPLLIVATVRDSRPELAPDVATLLAELERSPSVRRVALRGLDRDEVAQLTGRGAAEATAVLAETGGNPLLVTHAVSDGRGAALPIWLSRRDQLLDDHARGVLDQAAVFGNEFDADLLAIADETPLLAVLEQLEAAEAAGLVAPRPGHRTAYAFVHALFRSVRYDALPSRRRAELHARAADALASRQDDDRLRSERARHACLAVPPVAPSDAVALAVEAGQHLERVHAYDEAVSHYRRALDVARLLDPPASETILDLDVRIGAALHHRGDPTGLPMLLDAARRAATAADTAALVRAATAIPQFGAVGFIDPMPEGRAITQAALEALGEDPSAERARLLVDLASHWLFVDVEEALELARRAETVARQLGDAGVLGDVLLAARHLVSHPAHLEDRIRIGVELEALGRRLDRLAFKLAGVATLAATHLERGQLAAWTESWDRFATLLGDRELGFFRLQALSHRANRAFLAGDLARSEELAELTVPWSRGVGAGRVHAEGTIVVSRRLQARDEELLSRFERAATRSTDAWYRCSLAAVRARTGRLDEALATMRELRDEGFPIRRIYPWSVAVTDLAEAAEVAGAPDVAEHVLGVARPYSGRIAVSGPCPNRPFDQALAQASLAVGDTAAAVHFASRAVAASRHRQTPLFLVRELVFLAEARRRDGGPMSAIRPLVGEALTIGERLGAHIVSAEVDRYELPS